MKGQRQSQHLQKNYKITDEEVMINALRILDISEGISII